MRTYPWYLPRYPISDMKNPHPIRFWYPIFRTLWRPLLPFFLTTEAETIQTFSTSSKLGRKQIRASKILHQQTFLFGSYLIHPKFKLRTVWIVRFVKKRATILKYLKKENRGNHVYFTCNSRCTISIHKPFIYKSDIFL